MKNLVLLPLVAAPLFLSACTTTVVERRPAHTVVVERDPYYSHRYHPYQPYHPYHSDVVVVDRPYRSDVVVYGGAPAGVVYYNDRHGRYYLRGHRRVYVRVY